MKKFFEILTFLLKLAIAAIAPLALLKNMDFLLALMAAVSTFLVVCPKWYFKRKGYKYPLYLDFMVALSLWLHNWGIHFAFYPNVPYYDSYLHVYGTLVVGLLSFCFIFSLNILGKLKLGFWGHVILTGLLGLAMGAFWEIAEYTGDLVLHFNAQHGNTDTMNDLVWDVVGGFAAGFIMANVLKFIPAYKTEEHFAPFIYLLERLFGHHGKKSKLVNQEKVEIPVPDAEVKGADVWKEAPISAQEISSVATMFEQPVQANTNPEIVPPTTNAGNVDSIQR